jgi:peroxiredoxin family protein/TusA-related sulfurtransferase
MLNQLGFKNRNLIGGYKTWLMFNEEKWGEDNPKLVTKEVFCNTPCMAPEAEKETFDLDVCGMQCPGPLMKMQQRMLELKPGQRLKIIATDPGFPVDAAAWCNRSGNRLIRSVPENGRFSVTMEKTEAALSPGVACRTGIVPGQSGTKNLTMVVFSNDLDRAYATFIIANGAAAMGMEVTLFFTFWGLNILRKRTGPPVAKSMVESMFGLMMPKGSEALGLSKMHFAGLGTAMMKQVMADKNVAPLPELIESARKAGIKFVACTMSMDVMGIKREELIEGVIEGGVAAYIDSAANSGINLFV